MNLTQKDKEIILSCELSINHRLSVLVGTASSKFILRDMYIDYMQNPYSNPYIVLNVKDESGNLVEQDIEITERTYNSILVNRRDDKINRILNNTQLNNFKNQ